MDFKRIISETIGGIASSADEIYALLGVPAQSEMGDYCLPCFKLAKELKKPPQVIAAEIKDVLDRRRDYRPFATSVVGGYLNFRFDRAFVASHVLPELMSGGETFESEKSNGKTVCLDYSSINIAKPFHIGHLLTTAIGGSLYRIYKRLGYNVVGINHLGDWGTQFGKMIVAYLKWGDEKDVEKRGVHALVELYVRFHKEAENNPKLDIDARAWFKKIEDGDPEALRLFEYFRSVTLKDVNKVYERLGIKFDSYNGESFYNDKLDGVVELLKEKGLLKESEGAQIVDLSDYGMPPCLILRSDGASLYATRDLAAAIYRKNTYDFDKNLYVVAYQQNLHFKQVFKVLELCGFSWAKDCVHVPFGMVSLEGGASLSTRSGNVVYLSDVLETAVRKAEKVIEEKNPALENKREVAEQVGVGAVLFMALSTSRIKDLVFSYDKALSFDGETAPYLQYTHARCRSVREKCANVVLENVDYSVLSDEASAAVVLLLNRYEDVIKDAAEKYEPSILSKYLIDLAQSYNAFYVGHRIAGEEERVTKARLALSECVRKVLKDGLNLLLISAPDKM